MKRDRNERKIVIASMNEGKIAEFSSMLSPLGWTAISLGDLPDRPQWEENGDTFIENARIKAKAVAERYGMPALADDSGLCVDALDGRPGVFSARFAGEHASDEENNRKLMMELQQLGIDRLPLDHPRRRARFMCALVLYESGGKEVIAEGSCTGYIINEPRGAGGFGYDPLFYLPERDRTMAELSPAEKNGISHRSRALEQLKRKLARP